MTSNVPSFHHYPISFLKNQLFESNIAAMLQSRPEAINLCLHRKFGKGISIYHRNDILLLRHMRHMPDVIGVNYQNGTTHLLAHCRTSLKHLQS